MKKIYKSFEKCESSQLTRRTINQATNIIIWITISIGYYDS